MKRKFIVAVAAVSAALISIVSLPVYARGGGHGGGGGGHGGFSGGGHAGFSGTGRGGFSGGARGAGVSRGYTGAGISRSAGVYSPRSYSSGISTGRHAGYGVSTQRAYAPRTSTGSQIYRSSPNSQTRTAARQWTQSPRYSGSYYAPRDRSGASVARKSDMQSRYYSGANRDLRQQRAVTAARAANRPGSTWSKQNLTNKQRLDPQTTNRLRNWQGKASGWNDAKNNNHDHWRDRHHHDHDWWNRHCDAIVLVGWGYWGWYDGWWYPAWGYDPYYSYYDYNGPIYGYDALRPDEVIANVQAALQQLGYYVYAVDGVLGPATEAAIENYQRDYGLPVTGAIDQPTVRSLGLTT